MCDTTERAELRLLMNHHAPGVARAFARSSGCTEHSAEILDDALLLISELVTNAVEHGKQPIFIALECENGGLKVRVRDGSRALPRPRDAFESEEEGRGLALLDRISDAWGVESILDEYGSGKAVWFELYPPYDDMAAGR
jgi:anti-sigma regulatory factor (Ser/Thr protein kinase)